MLSFIDFIMTIWAGIAISIGSIIYVNIGGIFGAVFFSIGLMLVLFCRFKLFTGTIGFIQLSVKEIGTNLLILAGNFIGCSLSFLINPEAVESLVAAKLALPLLTVFVKAFICGVLIYFAVRTFKTGRWELILFAVSAFILAGAEHCIADACYIIGARAFTTESLLFLAVVIAGNALGAILLHQTLTRKEKYDIMKLEKN